MKNHILYFFILLTTFTFSQHAYLSEEVKTKMDLNKIDGLPTLTGIKFEHIVTISSGISDANYKNNDVKINEAIGNIKNDQGFLLAHFERKESGDLLIYFIGDVEYKLDAIKIALTNKNLIASSFEVVAKVVE
jgi:hypothetical protein